MRRQAVIDCGSNSFRLVEFTWTDAWWRRTDELFDTIRVGEGLEAEGVLQRKPMKRALGTLEVYAHYCRAAGIDDVRAVATSAIRDAGNQADLLSRVRERTGLEVRVLAPEEEAHYGYLAAVNTTTIADGVVFDIGGGSMQLVRVAGRLATDRRSWPLGAVRMTERFLPDRRAHKKQLKALRAHVRAELASAEWLERGGRITGVGGAVRNLAAAAQAAAGLPSFGVQGHVISADALSAIVDELADRPADERGDVPGIKPGRGDVILAGAVVVQEVLEAGGFEGIEVTEAGLREGVFFETLLAGQDVPLVEDVRRATVLNLAAQYDADLAHVRHVAQLSMQMWQELAEAGVHKGSPEERDLLWAAAMLHDIGTAVDYDDHHKHSRYLILNARLAGHTPRETALIGQMARYHRKGTPALGPFAALMRPGDEKLLTRCSAVLRVAEMLERARDQSVRETRASVHNGTVSLGLVGDGDVSVAQWAAEQEAEIFARAFGRTLEVTAAAEAG